MEPENTNMAKSDGPTKISDLKELENEVSGLISQVNKLVEEVCEVKCLMYSENVIKADQGKCEERTRAENRITELTLKLQEIRKSLNLIYVDTESMRRIVG